MSDACCICDRPQFGSKIPKTEGAAKHPLVVKVGEQHSSMVEIEDKMFYRKQVCIDCRPEFEKTLMDWLKKELG